jgi:1-acyl-sn-glycerol-3-phosphate acyltransferase
MILLRSFAFNLALYLHMGVSLVLTLPALVLPRAVGWWCVRGISRRNLWLVQAMTGIRVELRGLENLPDGGVLIASKHQSAFETISLVHLFREPAFILKRELMWIPLFGWFAARLRQIPVDRARGSQALKAMTARALDEMQHGRPIVIYPEGTRRPVGAEPAYKFGIAALYRETGMPVVPVALNSGLFWPRRGFRRFPGTLVVEFLPSIEPGLPAEQFLALLRDRIETASDRLFVEAMAVPHPPPLTPTAADRLRQLTQG